jgi:hypothetical protein
MRKTTTDVLVIGGAALGMSVLYRVSPDVGRTVSVMLSAMFLLALLAHFGRRWKRHWRGE